MKWLDGQGLDLAWLTCREFLPGEEASSVFAGTTGWPGCMASDSCGGDPGLYSLDFFVEILARYLTTIEQGMMCFVRCGTKTRQLVTVGRQRQRQNWWCGTGAKGDYINAMAAVRNTESNTNTI